MKIEDFKREFKVTILHQRAGVPFEKNRYVLWGKPFSLQDVTKDVKESVKFKTIDEALAYKLEDGRTLSDLVEAATYDDLFVLHFEGGRGSESDGKTFSFGSAGGPG